MAGDTPKFCPRCNKRPFYSITEDDNNFCRVCGAKMVPQVDTKCSQCKGIVRPQDRFCGSCGKEVTR